jgi:protein-S-isoprenylcysteine O-methyltransferase Ste14
VFGRIAKTLLFTLVAPGTVGVLLPQWLKNHAGKAPAPLAWLGLGMFFCGVAIYLWCAWDFASKGLGTPAPIDAPRVLVVKGLYRFTRNPMYVGVLSMILGQALYYLSAPIAVYAGVVLAAFYLFVLLYEEPTLRKLFGAQYDEYCERVPRWLGHLPKSSPKSSV